MSAQSQFGVKGGFDLTNISLSSSDTSLTFDMGTGFNIGVFGVFNLSDVLQLKPELLYAHRSASTKTDFLGLEVKSTFNFDYLELPINLNYLLSDKFSIYTGPYFALLLKSSLKTSFFGDLQEEDTTDDVRSNDFGFNIGASYNVNEKLFVNIGYTHGLQNLIDEDTADNEKLTSSAIRLAIGYTFGNSY
jgi:opacity protein-like surface antigen